MRIQVVGPGCPRCKETEKNVRAACQEMGIEAEIVKVEDIREYAKLGIRLTPAVLVDGKIVVQGKIPSVEELKSLLAQQGAGA